MLWWIQNMRKNTDVFMQNDSTIAADRKGAILRGHSPAYLVIENVAII